MMAKDANVYGADALVSEPELERLMHRIQDANARLVQLADRIEGVADRLYGATPKPASGAGTNAPHPSGTVPMLHMVIDALHDRISEVDNTFSRIGSL